MVEVRRSAVIPAPLVDVWAILRDFNGHDRWHPAVATSRIEDGRPADLVGAVRDFRLADGSRLREQLLALSDRDTSLAYCLLEAPLPLHGYVAHLRLRPVTLDGHTFWEWRSRFDPPASARDALVRLVAEDIYAAGFAAVRALVGGGSARRPSATPPAPVQHQPGLSASSTSLDAVAITVTRHGFPEVLRAAPLRVPPPGPGEVRLLQRAIGVNFIDVHGRTGDLALIRPPGGIGMEAAGTVESVGPGVTDLRVGDRVGYAGPPPGAYASARVMPAEALIPLPDLVPDTVAAAVLLKGITASFLLHEVARVEPGQTILVHAAAGGVGLLLCQWAAALGARVIGAVSSEAKAARARSAGCADVILYEHGDVAAAIGRLTDGRGADTVLDAVGRATFDASLRALAVRSHLVSYGQASGAIGAFDVGRLAERSLTLSRPSYDHYVGTPEQLQLHAGRLLTALRDGIVRPEAPTLYPLAEAARAQADLEARRSSGPLVLIP